MTQKTEAATRAAAAELRSRSQMRWDIHHAMEQIEEGLIAVQRLRGTAEDAGLTRVAAELDQAIGDAGLAYSRLRALTQANTAPAGDAIGAGKLP